MQHLTEINDLKVTCNRTFLGEYMGNSTVIATGKK